MTNVYAVILAGGRGERFWPLSRAHRPKQVLDLVGGRSLIRQAVERLAGFVPPERVLVITGAALVDPIRADLRELSAAQVIGEPVGRDTAAACALATALVRARDPEGVVCILTADQVIGDLPVFVQTLRDAAEVAVRERMLVTIGIAPTAPSTGYGYIEAGAALPGGAGATVFARARRFVEKPPVERAREYLLAGTFFWNAGMFVWSVATFEQAIAQHRPQLLPLLRAAAAARDAAALDAVLRRDYPALEKISVDYAVMERAGNIAVAVGRFRWFDVGSLSALADHFPADAAGNVAVGRCEALDATGNLVVSKDRLTALIGVRDLIVVQSEGVTLVCHRDRAQDVRALVRELEKNPANRDVL
jgi:mannose-1-phosphate guanylyltransferase